MDFDPRLELFLTFCFIGRKAPPFLVKSHAPFPVKYHALFAVESLAEYLGLVTGQISKLSKTFDKYLDAATPADAPAAFSLVREMLPTGPLRADQVSLAQDPPLRVMSLGQSQIYSSFGPDSLWCL